MSRLLLPRRGRLGLFVLVVAGSAPSGVGAGAQRPAHPTNLQVLPATLSTDSVFSIMGGITVALGVTCGRCHVGGDNRTWDSTNFASDVKPAKNVARSMMELVSRLNHELLPPMVSRVPTAMEVTCATCHAGSLRPVGLVHVRTAPSRRSGFGMVYDSARRRVVLFGGSDSAYHRLGDTWTWKNGLWERLNVSGPSPRNDCLMAYDSRRDRVVLFGGSTDAGRAGDTWEFDGSTWTHVSDSGPAPRALASMAYDARRARTVLFGGSGAGSVTYGDTWEWDGGAWHEVADIGPSARSSHALVYDAARASVLLVGGYAASPSRADPALGDLWEWDGARWRELDSAGIPPRFHAAVGYDGARDRVVVFGGFSGTGRDSTTWEWDQHGWRRVAMGGRRGPPARAEHGGIFVPREGFLIFGGITGQGMSLEARGAGKVDDSWVWTGELWRSVIR